MESLDPFFFRKGLLLSKRFLEKNEWYKRFRQTFDLQSRFCSLLAQNSPKEGADLARNGSKFPWDPKLEAFTVVLFSVGGWVTFRRHGTTQERTSFVSFDKYFVNLTERDENCVFVRIFSPGDQVDCFEGGGQAPKRSCRPRRLWRIPLRLRGSSQGEEGGRESEGMEDYRCVKAIHSITSTLFFPSLWFFNATIQLVKINWLVKNNLLIKINWLVKW